MQISPKPQKDCENVIAKSYPFLLYEVKPNLDPSFISVLNPRSS